jgi:hypothetical protein
MNERIQELMEQAGLYDFVIESMGIDEEMQKFAELIVRECAGLTLDHRNSDYYQGWLDYRDEIRRHWGIEP